MKNMKYLLLIAFIAVLASCGSSKTESDTYYVNWGSTGFYQIESGNFNWKFPVSWGSQFKPATVSNYVTNIKKVNYVHVVSVLNKDSDGYINEASLIKNPIARGVILNSVPLYIQPTITSTKKVSAFPPVLTFITATNQNTEGTWAQLQPYKHDENFFNVSDYKKLDWMSEYYTKMEYVSTKNEDVKLVIGVITTMRTYLSASTTEDEEKLAKAKTDAVNELNTLISTYPNSGAILYAQQSLELVDPTAASGDMEGNPLLDEDMSGDVYDSGMEEDTDAIEDASPDTEIIEEEEL